MSSNGFSETELLGAETLGLEPPVTIIKADCSLDKLENLDGSSLGSELGRIFNLPSALDALAVPTLGRDGAYCYLEKGADNLFKARVFEDSSGNTFLVTQRTYLNSKRGLQEDYVLVMAGNYADFRDIVLADLIDIETGARDKEANVAQFREKLLSARARVQECLAPETGDGGFYRVPYSKDALDSLSNEVAGERMDGEEPGSESAAFLGYCSSVFEDENARRLVIDFPDLAGDDHLLLPVVGPEGERYFVWFIENTNGLQSGPEDPTILIERGERDLAGELEDVVGMKQVVEKEAEGLRKVELLFYS